MEDVTMVIGGQFGSEGKGAFIAWLTDPIRHPDPLFAIRTGGPNAGHSMLYNGQVYKMRHIPCTWHNPKARMALGPGAVLDLHHLLDVEIPMVEKALGESLVGRFFIDPMAAIIRPSDINAEQEMVASIGSTAHGIGAATAARIMRVGMLARDIPALAPYIRSVSREASVRFQTGEHILVETTQGFGLSLLYSGFYPYATSRDITPAQALNDAGIPSQIPHSVIMVVRTYPIRVHGNSGPMHKEITWEELNKRGAEVDPERTTVTNKIRRIGEWDPRLVKEACRILLPTSVALTFFDYVRPDLKEKAVVLDTATAATLNQFQQDLTSPIHWVSTGFQKITPLFKLPQSSLN